MFSRMVKTGDRNEDDMDGYSPAFRCRVAYCFTVMSYLLAPLANAHHIQ